MSKVLNVKVWFWVVIVANGVFGGLVSSLWAADTAEIWWGAENVQAHDEFYERLIGYMIFTLIFVLIGIAVLVSGRVFHQLALITSGSLLFAHLAGMVYGNANGYGSPGEWVVPLVLDVVLAATAIRALRQPSV
jgi:hypothetical protein